jgi:hypothetical protein
MPIPIFPIKVFIGLTSTDPVSVTLAFLTAMHNYNMNLESGLSMNLDLSASVSISSVPNLIVECDTGKTPLISFKQQHHPSWLDFSTSPINSVTYAPKEG